MNNKAVAAIIAAKDEGRVFGRVREAEPVVSTRVTAADAREAVAAVHTVRAFIDQCQDPHLAAAHAASLSHAVDGEAGIKLRAAVMRLTSRVQSLKRSIEARQRSRQGKVHEFFSKVPAGARSSNPRPRKVRRMGTGARAAGAAGPAAAAAAARVDLTVDSDEDIDEDVAPAAASASARVL